METPDGLRNARTSSCGSEWADLTHTHSHHTPTLSHTCIPLLLGLARFEQLTRFYTGLAH